MSKPRKTVVREADWVDAIGIARIVRGNSKGSYRRWVARKLFRMALALLEVDEITVEQKS